MRIVPVSLLLFVFGCLGCSHRVSSSFIQKLPPRADSSFVGSIGLVDSIPYGAEIVGQIKIGDTGFSTRCPWEDALKKAKLETNRLGGNAFKITKYREPSFFSSCHRVWAKVLVIPEVDMPRGKLSKPKQFKLPRKRLSLNIGQGEPVFDKSLGNTSSGTSEKYQNYILNNKNGYHFSTSFDYFFVRRFGVGVNYNRFWSRANLNNVDILLPDGNLVYGDISNNVRLNYYDFLMLYRNILWQGKAVLNMGVGFGYLTYADKQTVIDSYNINGSSWCAASEVGLDFFIKKQFAIGVQWQWMAGVLKEYKKTDGLGVSIIALEKGHFLDIDRRNLSFGIHYYW